MLTLFSLPFSYKNPNPNSHWNVHRVTLSPPLIFSSNQTPDPQPDPDPRPGRARPPTRNLHHLHRGAPRQDLSPPPVLLIISYDVEPAGWGGDGGARGGGQQGRRRRRRRHPQVLPADVRYPREGRPQSVSFSSLFFFFKSCIFMRFCETARMFFFFLKLEWSLTIGKDGRFYWIMYSCIWFWQNWYWSLGFCGRLKMT